MLCKIISGCMISDIYSCNSYRLLSYMFTLSIVEIGHEILVDQGSVRIVSLLRETFIFYKEIYFMVFRDIILGYKRIISF